VSSVSSLVRRPAGGDPWLRKGYLKRSYSADSAVADTWIRKLLLGCMIAAVIVVPFFATTYWMTVLDLVALASLGSLGLNILIGVAGQMAIGTAAFLAIGAYSAALFGIELHVPFLLVLPLSTILTAVIGALVALPALRLRGLYLLIGTLALHFIVIYAVTEYQTKDVGEIGFLFPNPSIFGWQLETPTRWYIVLTVISACGAIAATNLLRSRFGRAWMAVRERDIAAEIMGIDVTRTKIYAFMVSAAFTGCQGVLLAYYTRAITYSSFSLDVAIQYIAMIIIGGLGSVLGSYLGAAFVVALPFLLSSLAQYAPSSGPIGSLFTDNVFELQIIIYGLAIILFLLIEPRGLVQLWVRFTTYLRLWPFQKERLMSNGS
jgi:branched-chain amino acid transport system permease protein